jgi:hypothetical protein
LLQFDHFEKNTYESLFVKPSMMIPPEIIGAYGIIKPVFPLDRHDRRKFHFIVFMDQPIGGHQDTIKESMLFNSLETIGTAGRDHLASIPVDGRNVFPEPFNTQQ